MPTKGTTHTDFTKVKLTRQSDIYVMSYTQSCRITDLVVLPGDLLLLVDRRNQTVKLADPASGQLLDQLQLPGEPWGLCLLPGDRAAVTIPDKSTIQTISIANKKQVLQDVITIYGKCYGINYVNDYFVVGFNYPAKVALIQTTGKIYKSISKDSQNKALFRNPEYICVTTENTSNVIYVSDYVTRTITRLSEKLQVLQSFTDTELSYPRGMASVGGGQLLVVDGGLPSTLSVLDVTTGKFTPLLGWGINLGWTRCVAVSHTLGTLYVHNWLYGCDIIRQYRFKNHFM